MGALMRRGLTGLLLSALVGLVSTSNAQQGTKAPPNVTHYEEPTYPPLAREARIQGDVRLTVTTDGHSAINVEVKAGHPILAQAAANNVRTWTFVDHAPGTFDVAFHYRIVTSDVVALLKEPGEVEVSALAPPVIVNCTAVDLGTWKAKLKSARGNIQATFALSLCGSLYGEVIGAQGQKEEISSGHVDGDIIAFSATLKDSNGQQVKVSLLGKMTKDRITGTYLDYSGIIGKWTAVREQ
jgi:hypothetical protein